MADWNRVQGAQSQFGAGASAALNFGVAISNNSIVKGAILVANTVSVTSIIDDKGNSYTPIVSDSSGTNLIVGYRSPGLITNGPIMITATLSGTSSFVWLMQDEFSIPTGTLGISSDGSAHAGNVGAGTLSTPNFTTSQNDDLVYSVCQTTGATTHGASFSVGTNDGANNVSEWLIQSTPSSTVNGTYATQTGTAWIVAFATAPVMGGGVVLGAGRLS